MDEVEILASPLLVPCAECQCRRRAAGSRRACHLPRASAEGRAYFASERMERCPE